MKRKGLPIRAKRERVYGNAQENHDNIGLQWTGLLQQHYGIKLPKVLPGSMVATMMASLKCNRAATPLEFNPDNYTDGMAYFEIARDIDRRRQR